MKIIYFWYILLSIFFLFHSLSARDTHLKELEQLQKRVKKISLFKNANYLTEIKNAKIFSITLQELITFEKKKIAFNDILKKMQKNKRDFLNQNLNKQLIIEFHNTLEEFEIFISSNSNELFYQSIFKSRYLEALKKVDKLLMYRLKAIEKKIDNPKRKKELTELVEKIRKNKIIEKNIPKILSQIKKKHNKKHQQITAILEKKNYYDALFLDLKKQSDIEKSLKIAKAKKLKKKKKVTISPVSKKEKVNKKEKISINFFIIGISVEHRILHSNILLFGVGYAGELSFKIGYQYYFKKSMDSLFLGVFYQNVVLNIINSDQYQYQYYNLIGINLGKKWKILDNLHIGLEMGGGVILNKIQSTRTPSFTLILPSVFLSYIF